MILLAICCFNWLQKAYTNYTSFTSCSFTNSFKFFFFFFLKFLKFVFDTCTKFNAFSLPMLAGSLYENPHGLNSGWKFVLWIVTRWGLDSWVKPQLFSENYKQPWQFYRARLLILPLATIVRCPRPTLLVYNNSPQLL